MNFLFSLCGALSLLAASSVAAQSWAPTRTITIVVPVPPGSSTDLVARVLAERLPARLGQQVLVENRPGASGLIGANAVAKAAPDGHTLAVVASTLFIAPHVLPRGAGGGVDVIRDFTPIVKTASSPLLILVNPETGVKTPQELVAYLKRNPGAGYASSGNGSPMHIAGELFRKATGVEMTLIPYKGVMPAVADTVSGQVKIAFSALGGVGQFITSGRLNAVAVIEKQRTALLPGVPTLTESGIAGVEVGVFFPLLAPAATPAAIVARLNEEANAILRAPEIRERLLSAGVEVRGGSAEDAAREIREEFARFGRVVAEFGIKGE